MSGRPTRRDAARGAALHPGVPRANDRDQVRRCRDARRGAPGGVRPDVVLLKYVGMNPVIVQAAARRSRATWSGWGWRCGSSRGCASPTPRRSRWRRWSCSARSTRTSSRRLNRHGQPAVGLGGRGRVAVRRPAAVPNASEVGFVGEIERVNVDVINHIAEDYVPVIASVGTDREGTPTTSTPTRRPARSRRRCTPTRRSS